MNAVGIFSKKRFVLVLNGELVEIGLEKDDQNDALMKNLRRVMRKKYTQDEIDERVSITEVCFTFSKRFLPITHHF